MTFDAFTYLILPTLIFLARIADVSLGTLRLILTTKGYKIAAPVLGFFEVLIYIITMNQVISDMTNVWLYITYAAGFAAGNYVGIILEEYLSIGKVMIRIITQKGSKSLRKNLREAGCRLTTASATGKNGKVKIIFSVVPKKSLKKIIQIINQTNPNAFYSIEDIRHAKDTGPIQNKTIFKKSLYLKKR